MGCKMAATIAFTWGKQWRSQALDEDLTEAWAQTKLEDTWIASPHLVHVVWTGNESLIQTDHCYGC